MLKIQLNKSEKSSRLKFLPDGLGAGTWLWFGCQGTLGIEGERATGGPC